MCLWLDCGIFVRAARRTDGRKDGIQWHLVFLAHGIPSLNNSIHIPYAQSCEICRSSRTSA